MSSIKGTKTEQNILKAFAGESQARNRYDFFAKQAKKEGFEQIAAIFEETADNERSHAKRLFKLLEGGELEITAAFPAGIIGKTVDNLLASANGEHYENSIMYPEFAKIAQEEGFPKIAAVFKSIANAEIHHEKRFLALKENIEKGRVFEREQSVKWVCKKCGFVHEGNKPPATCPACEHPKEYFELLVENY